MQATAVQGKKHSMTTDYIMKVLGLEFCADTLVGNDMIRGISGGQKKRVTTGEKIYFSAHHSLKTLIINAPGPSADSPLK